MSRFKQAEREFVAVHKFDTIATIKMPVTARLSVLSLVVALSTLSADAHPLFNGQIVSRYSLLPEYDYVVIGAGPAGLTVANRLSEQNSKLYPWCCKYANHLKHYNDRY